MVSDRYEYSCVELTKMSVGVYKENLEVRKTHKNDLNQLTSFGKLFKYAIKHYS